MLQRIFRPADFVVARGTCDMITAEGEAMYVK